MRYDISFRIGTIDAVNADGTYDVDYNGVIISGVGTNDSNSYQEGDSVKLLSTGGDRNMLSIDGHSAYR